MSHPDTPMLRPFRRRAIRSALKYGILPWWLYERHHHCDFRYPYHLWINLELAWRWAAGRQDLDDLCFELETNWGHERT